MNDITNVINKIERKLGLMPLTPYLPEKYGKKAWADVITDQTLVTFSRYFPWKVPFHVTSDVPRKDEWYVLDEFRYFGGAKILGIQDIDWSDFSTENSSIGQVAGYGSYVDFYGLNLSYEDIMGMQMRADSMSMFNYGIYIEYRDPNMFRLQGLTNTRLLSLSNFKINVLLVHPDTLQTIPPTKMETFEDLAKADIAEFLSKNLKYWDQMETVFATVDLKLSDLEQAADTRAQIIEKLENTYVTAANNAIPYIITV